MLSEGRLRIGCIHEAENMDGIASGAVSDHDRLGRFTAGNTEYTAKKRRIADRIAQLSLDYDASTPSLRMLLSIAAHHLDEAERTRSPMTRTRAANAATRLLRQIPRRPPPAAPSLYSYRKAKP
jgi:hypothetical protein